MIIDSEERPLKVDPLKQRLQFHACIHKKSGKGGLLGTFVLKIDLEDYENNCFFNLSQINYIIAAVTHFVE